MDIATHHSLQRYFQVLLNGTVSVNQLYTTTSNDTITPILDRWNISSIDTDPVGVINANITNFEHLLANIATNMESFIRTQNNSSEFAWGVNYTLQTIVLVQ